MTDKKKPVTEEDIFSEKNVQCPYHMYNRMRTEHGTEEEPSKIVWSDHINAWVIMDYKTIKHILTDHETFSSKNSIYGNDVAESLADENIELMITMDGDKHRKARQLAQDAFKTEEIFKWEESARRIAREQVEYIIATRDFSVMKNLGIPIPIKVICEVLGIEYDDQKVEFIKRETDAAVNFLGHRKGDRFADIEKIFMENSKTTLPMFVLGEVYKKQERPGNDLLTRILTTEFELDDKKVKLDELQIIAYTSLLLFAGNVTTTNLIGQCFKYLGQDEQLRKEVQKDYKLIPEMVEETLRMEAPGQAAYRLATKDVELEGQTIKKGDQLLLSWAAAGRDSKKYECPHKFDIYRADKKHLSFGAGKHFCIGAKLARMEAQVTLEETFNRFEDFWLPEDYIVEYIDAPLFRGPKELKLKYILK